MPNKTYGRAPFGLRDIGIGNTAGTIEDLRAAQTATFTVNTTNNVLRGDDVDVESVTFASGGEIKFKAGGYSSAAMAIMTGITLGVTSTSPTEVTELQINAGQNFPYFRVYARMLGPGTDDMHILVYKAKLSDGFSMSAGDNEWVAPEFTARVFNDDTHGLFEIIQNETGTLLPTS